MYTFFHYQVKFLNYHIFNYTDEKNALIIEEFVSSEPANIGRWRSGKLVKSMRNFPIIFKEVFYNRLINKNEVIISKSIINEV